MKVILHLLTFTALWIITVTGVLWHPQILGGWVNTPGGMLSAGGIISLVCSGIATWVSSTIIGED